MGDSGGEEEDNGSRALAYGVHVLTALGAALGFLALQAVFAGNLTVAFVWLGVALVVDAVDGPLARRFAVKSRAKRYDGALLDLVVDFVTYVFVPAAMLLRPEVMAAPYGVIAGLAVTLASALYFADTGIKTDDWWFRGFPAVWNIVVFYVVAFAPPSWLALALILVATALMFLPVVFVHPVRVRRWRWLTLAMLALWAIAAAATLWRGMVPDAWSKAGLALAACYFVGLGLARARMPAR
ncbi:CDP-alcohol phosphatidyltransferase family protein [Bosea sp. (in: a-proteobacteria)]|uniref:CDP-alcohol phosphatidyltransferase family protein n=1 Tax=Bosea sp. (in: a-proteobacteria) TaxID=1871050 RepID=UPI0025BF96AF|nr:CDP-alcohol phosphatidyltransferase family protein [Bosea sp. (in: a-proteobacteria)]MBR3194815.1 CDP-alcohol phosphatidyltransferase family protein [Bosea sp. (in: a-proteobacteria)]